MSAEGAKMETGDLIQYLFSVKDRENMRAIVNFAVVRPLDGDGFIYVSFPHNVAWARQRRLMPRYLTNAHKSVMTPIMEAVMNKKAPVEDIIQSGKPVFATRHLAHRYCDTVISPKLNYEILCFPMASHHEKGLWMLYTLSKRERLQAMYEAHKKLVQANLHVLHWYLQCNAECISVPVSDLLDRHTLRIVNMKIQGKTDREIGEALGLSESAAKKRWQRTLDRFEANSTLELIAQLTPIIRNYMEHTHVL